VKPDPAFERLYEKEAQSVFSAVYLLCRDRAIAEDATQEAFTRAFERWDRLEGEPWAGGWVATTAMNVARRSLRRGRLLRPTPRDHLDPDERLDLWIQVRGLSRRQQEVVVLHYRLGVPVNEIAQILGCQEGTVRTHLARAREVLRTALAEVSDGD